MSQFPEEKLVWGPRNLPKLLKRSQAFIALTNAFDVVVTAAGW